MITALSRFKQKFKPLWHQSWSQNIALYQLLGLCPLLAVSSTVTNALSLGLATIFVLILSNGLISLHRNFIPRNYRLPIFVMIIASMTTVIEVALQAVSFELHNRLGIFIPLIVTNCAVLGRAESFAYRNKVWPSLWDGLTTGIGFLIALLLCAIFREVLGQGTLFSELHLLLGDWAKELTLQLPKHFQPLLIAALPPGAFFTLGILIAWRNWYSHQATLNRDSHTAQE